MELLSDAQKAEFSRNGILILKGIYDLEQQVITIQRTIYQIIGLVI